mmetsp:Transcript_1455/g.3752  ORF Transcript_1455/g.3752 Transcript_1455/m.3752 type:complete len:124 (-) Transcript_1455:86-457(-)
MAYKADYRPAELLCPTSLEWFAFDEALRAKMAEHGGRLLSLGNDTSKQSEFTDLFQDEERTAAKIVEAGKHHGILCMVYDKVISMSKLLQVIEPAYKSQIEKQSSTWMASCGPAALEMLYKCA